ncbi:hypothetical protein ABZ802_16700 [Streptomyces sp. NPDC047737]|uniref:hypothetical protein n=1 Tax=Streptomyces sp. NPDC047737 TaxID=3155740 RepID=UPI0033F2F1FC
MTPYSLAFYVDAVRTGTVLGLRPSDSPGRVADVMGTDFAENRAGKRAMFRDYGLAEFHWQRAAAGDPWSGHHFSLQVHRLVHGDRTAPGEVLGARYGRFAPRLPFEKLRRLLDRRGVPLVEIPEPAANAPRFRTFWQPGSLTAVHFIGARDPHRAPGELRVGDVYRIEAPVTAQQVAWREERARGRGTGAGEGPRVP